ncbi:MAG: TIGR01777 family oxidoreductase [Candidatus Methylacidiphilales bacterium]
MRKLVLAGGGGFLGQILADHFVCRGYEVVVLSRDPRAKRVRDPSMPGRWVEWDGVHVEEWAEELENAHALINLAGRTVNCRYHQRNRREMMDSRIQSTRVLGKAVRACRTPPEVWIQSSTATIYRHRYDEAAPHDEATGETGWHPDAKDRFSIELATAWEQAFADELTPATRRVVMRTAMVFGSRPGGVYEVLRRLVRCGLGGTMGDGRQVVSWIHADDFTAVMEWMISRQGCSGIYNVCAPHPLPNHEVMRILRKTCGAPWGLGVPHPYWMLEMGAWLIRTETELVIKSRRVVPGRLLAEGFRFRFEDFESMAQDLVRSD